MPEKFWSDDFDMDLMKVFPEATNILGETAETKMWTVGNEWHGRLNHPSVWNTGRDACSAFAWLDKPNLKHDEHGWVSVFGCVSSEPEIECTWLEFLRDQWPHGFEFNLILPWRETVRFPPPPRIAFERIMYDLRGWTKAEAEDIQEHRIEAFKWLMRSAVEFMACLEKRKMWEEQWARR